MECVSSGHGACVSAVLAAFLLTSSPALAQEGGLAPDPAAPLAPLPDLGVEWPDLSVGADAAQAAQTEGVEQAERRYHVEIRGIEAVADTPLRSRFDELSSLAQNEDDPANVAQIDRRAREDEALLEDLLRSYGYYDAEVTARVSREGASTVVTLSATPGEAYRVAEVRLPGAPAGEVADAFAIRKGDRLDAERVLAAEAAVNARLGREGYAFAEPKPLEVTIDRAGKTATISLPVEAGAPQRFGQIRVEGTLFSAEHVGRIARFRAGDRYDAALLEDLRRALIATSLVSVAEIRPVPGAQPGTVDVAVRLERAPPRTLALEAGYGTGEGVRAELSWQHRNLIKPEGAVTFRGIAGTREQLLGASLRRGNFLQRDQLLVGQVVASHTEREAYEARTFTLGAGIERQTNIIWQKDWTWSFGAEFSASDERDTVGPLAAPRRRTFLIGAVPTSLAYDGSDDLLDPTRGYRLSGRLSPELSLQNGAFGYVRAQIDGSLYVPVSPRATLAGRVRLGTIAGAPRDRIAPSRRYYAGGGGSVRGFGYQRIGPRDANDDPEGGRGLAEFSIEARVRVGDFGIVPFIDAGNIYSAALPDFTGMRFGTGIGVRYHTSFGPIRVDVGTPINPRSGDPRVAVYVSLGQAF